MTEAAVGRKLPGFSLESTSGPITDKDLRGRKTVLYFYPKDNTPGCTLEGQEFRDLHAKFRRAGIAVFGISRDSVRSHEGFKSKQGFPFELISDPDELLCKAFDVIRDKTMYGKKVRGIERSTFLADSGGVLRKEWRKVKPEGHAAEVLEAAKALA
jgi:thioredoxin-dependent peroxiredoxin